MTQTVYIPVDVDTDLPLPDEATIWQRLEGHSKSLLIQKKENVYVFTPQEYKEQIDAAILLGRTLEMRLNNQP